MSDWTALVTATPISAPSSPSLLAPATCYASFPRRRVAVQVAHREHDDVARLDPIEDPVRKPVDDCPTRLAMKHLVLERIFGDATQRRVHLGDKLSSQPAPLPTRTDEQQSERLPSRGAEPPVSISQLAQDVVAGLFPRLDVSGICLMLVNPFV